MSPAARSTPRKARCAAPTGWSMRTASRSTSKFPVSSFSVVEFSRPTLVISASSFRLLASHRAGLIQALQDEGYGIVAAAPDGEGKEELRKLGAEIAILPM